jgi:asparagine synthase (glutamine-hydrolysing)
MLENVLIKDGYGWVRLEKDKRVLWFKGYLTGNSENDIMDYFSKANGNLTISLISKFVSNLKGNFAFIWKYRDYVIASVDRINSIPIFYTDGDILIGNNAPILKESRTFEVNNNAALQIAMSGYTLGKSTLFDGLYQLTAGSCLLFYEDKIEINNYYTYSPWKVVANSESFLINKLTETILNSVEDSVESIDGEQIVIPLSAGSDSRLIASSLRYLGVKNVVCFAYGNKNGFESKTSQAVSKTLGYDWYHVPLSSNSQKTFFASQEFIKYNNYFETYSSIPFHQDVSSISWLKANNIISKNAVFINGNTGDYISGGHIPKSIINGHMGGDSYENAWSEYLDKHFSLWGVLRSKDNDNLIRQNIISILTDRSFVIKDNVENLHGFFECMEYFGRQSKYIVNMQRSYEFYGYNWRMPLWSNQMMDFWESVELKYKADKNLYLKTLFENNWGGVWKDIPINKTTFKPLWMSIARLFTKSIVYPFGVESWDSVEANVFRYYMDEQKNSNIVPYSKVLFDNRGQRHWASWWAEIYLVNYGLSRISNKFPESSNTIKNEIK